MKRCLTARQIPVLLMFLFLFLGIGKMHLAFAGGNQEDPLMAADTLISERKYNEAILMLTQFIKDNPERFDDAQKRLQKIVKLREEYNVLAEELLNILVTDPTNDERKLAMIRQLESLEAAPNRASREFILKTKETALFTYNRAQFEQIMADGRSLIDTGDYLGAARRYTDGFSLYREEFYQAGYGDMIVANVNQGLRDIQQNLDRFGILIPELQKAAETFINQTKTVNLSTRIESLVDPYNNLESLLLQYAATRNVSAAVGREFETQFALLQSGDANLGDSSFLPFAFRFILGRRTEVQPEGIVGAMDTLWMKEVNAVETAMIQTLDRLYENLLAEYQTDPLALLETKEETLQQLSDFTLRVLSIWSAIASAEIQFQVTDYGRTIALNKVPVFLSVQALLESTNTMRSYYSILKDLIALKNQQDLVIEQWKSGINTDNIAVSSLLNLRESMTELINRLQGSITNGTAILSKYTGFKSQNIPMDTGIERIQQSVDALAFLDQQLQNQDLSLVTQRYTIENTRITRNLNQRNTDYQRAVSLLQGIQVTPSSGAAYLAKYPKESLPLLTDLDHQLTDDILATQNVRALYSIEPPPIIQHVSIAGLQRETDVLLQKLQSLQVQVKSNITVSQRQIALAESLKLEGDRRYQEAQTALRNLNFDLARQRLQQSGDRYDASLAVQEAPELRAIRDQRLLMLAAEISKTENEMVVRDVRRMITDAKKFYFNGDFNKAEDTLMQAQNRWKTTNVDDEPEISYWLTLARSALSIKTGRTIPSTAPLYPEMSQLLSSAQRAFETGKALLEANKRTESLVQFELARKNIQEVRILFPLNQEAGLLELRIDQLVDPTAFTANFRQRLANAQAKLGSQPQEGYAELQDLYTINPSYPGIKTIIEKAEIQLGLRLPPPDPKAIARANELISAAKRIIDANIRSQFPVALAQLNEALKLNPNNEQAISLKDRIQTDVGGQATDILSNAAEREYQRAVQELQNGNTIVALSIVQQLLQDPKNRNSTKLIELQTRIQSRL